MRIGVVDDPIAEFTPVGALTIGYPGTDKRSPSLKRGHRPLDDVVHHGRWASAVPAPPASDDA